VHESDILLRDLDDDGILRLTLNDTGRRNAPSEAMPAELGATFADPRANRTVAPGRSESGRPSG
jgi:enoyl-CoA hydratase/carnithine racemase